MNVLIVSGFQVKNLFAGCACCSLSGEMISTFQDIQKNYHPDWVILETTGVAYPQGIKDRLKQFLNLDTMTLVLVDAVRWMRIRNPMANLLEGQIVGSRAVLLNKIDLADPAALDEIVADIQKIDENTVIYKICALQGIDESIWKEILTL